MGCEDRHQLWETWISIVTAAMRADFKRPSVDGSTSVMSSCSSPRSRMVLSFSASHAGFANRLLPCNLNNFCPWQGVLNHFSGILSCVSGSYRGAARRSSPMHSSNWFVQRHVLRAVRQILWRHWITQRHNLVITNNFLLTVLCAMAAVAMSSTVVIVLGTQVGFNYENRGDLGYMFSIDFQNLVTNMATWFVRARWRDYSMTRMPVLEQLFGMVLYAVSDSKWSRHLQGETLAAALHGLVQRAGAQWTNWANVKGDLTHFRLHMLGSQAVPSRSANQTWHWLVFAVT